MRMWMWPTKKVMISCVSDDWWAYLGTTNSVHTKLRTDKKKPSYTSQCTCRMAVLNTRQNILDIRRHFDIRSILSSSCGVVGVGVLVRSDIGVSHGGFCAAHLSRCFAVLHLLGWVSEWRSNQIYNLFIQPHDMQALPSGNPKQASCHVPQSCD